MATDSVEAPMWKRIVAGILDFLLVFLVGGYAIAKFTGDTTEAGFELNGAPALVLFALVIGYFVVFNKFLGGTVFKRIFGIAGK
ncbi:MAG: RDD family protein [Paracoccaceae bacterium]